MLGGAIHLRESTSGLDDVLSVGITPGDFAGLHGREDLDLVTVDGQDAVGLVDLEVTIKAAVSRVVLEHVLHVLDVNEGVVDSGDPHLGILEGGLEGKATDTTETVDSNVDGAVGSGVRGGHCVGNIDELGLEGSTTDKETVNVGLRGEGGGVTAIDGTTVDDADGVGYISRDVVLDPVTDGSMHLLGLLGGGNITSTDSPDGLVGDHEAAPVLHLVGVGSELLDDELDGLSRVTDLLGLAEAADDAESLFLSKLGLGGNHLVALTLVTPALGVTEDHPVYTHVREHIGRHLAGESTVASDRAVLSGNTEVRAEGVLEVGKVDRGRGDHNLGILAHAAGVEGVDKALHGSLGTIGLPVATNKEAALGNVSVATDSL
mmetsp:Transcript_485/g.961  ORF Transcript_485/g.961 Transcript_485/m.961 type:complete len:376 (+) Transcript_485:919-2046(+)